MPLNFISGGGYLVAEGANGDYCISTDRENKGAWTANYFPRRIEVGLGNLVSLKEAIDKCEKHEEAV